MQEHHRKFRAIDNGRASGHNGATVTCERVRATSLEFLASVAEQFLGNKESLLKHAHGSGVQKHS